MTYIVRMIVQKANGYCETARWILFVGPSELFALHNVHAHQVDNPRASKAGVTF